VLPQEQHGDSSAASTAAAAAASRSSSNDGAVSSSTELPKLHHGPAAAAAAAATAEPAASTGSTSGSAAAAGSSSGVKAVAAAAAAAGDALSGLGLGSAGSSAAGGRAKASKPKLAKRLGSSSSTTSHVAAAAAGAEGEEAEEGEEATSRLVELPAPEALSEPNSTALAAVQAAVRQDQSRTAASRAWWPFCFKIPHLASLSSSAAVVLGLTTPPAAEHSPMTTVVRPFQALPSLKPPWWAPVTGGGHKLQRWFGLDLFVLLQPASYSRRLLDAAEASSLMSVGRLALSSSGVGWPLLMPVHDALRDAYCGLAQVWRGSLGCRVASG
jgi:hypothetical protein